MKKLDFNSVVHLIALSLFVVIVAFFTAMSCNAQGLPRSQERMYKKALKTVLKKDRSKPCYSRERFTYVLSKIDSLNIISGIILTRSKEKAYREALFSKQAFKVYTREEFLFALIQTGYKPPTTSVELHGTKVVSGGTIGVGVFSRR